MLRLIFLIASILIPNIYAQGACSTAKKNGNQYPVCSFGLQNIFLVCGTYSFEEAGFACSQNGGTLAIISPLDNTAFYALNVTGECAYNFDSAWIAAYDSISGQPCGWLDIDGSAVLSNGEGCFDEERAVLCMQQITTVLEIVTTATATTSITATETIQLCPSGSPCDCGSNCRRRNCPACPERIETTIDGETVEFPRCCDPQDNCRPICQSEQNGLYVLASFDTPYILADRECRKYGLTLADLTSSLIIPFMELSQQCAEDGASYWIRSFNGAGGSESCVWITGPPEGLYDPFQPIYYGLNDEVCQNANVTRILCRDGSAADTGMGMVSGLFDYTTTIATGTITVFTTTLATETTTVTYYPGK